MKRALPILLCLLLCASALAAAEAPAGEGYAVRDNRLSIRLWADGAAGHDWLCEVDEGLDLVDETSAGPREGEPADAPLMRIWQFAPQRDGESLITFSYGAKSDPEAVERMLCYTVTVKDGLIDDVMAEDLSGDIEASGDDDAVVPYDGATGGVALNVPEGMVETETDEGALLSGEDGLTTILIDYQPADSAQELFEQLKDVDSAAAVYEAEDGTQVISSTVEPDTDPPSATLVLSTKEGFVVYTGYQAPEGGVLHVHTTYLSDATQP